MAIFGALVVGDGDSIVAGHMMRLLVPVGIEFCVWLRSRFLFRLCHSEEVDVDPEIIFTDVIEAAEGLLRPANVRVACASIRQENLRRIPAKLSRQVDRLFEQLGKQGVVGRLIQSRCLGLRLVQIPTVLRCPSHHLSIFFESLLLVDELSQRIDFDAPAHFLFQFVN